MELGQQKKKNYCKILLVIPTKYHLATVDNVSVKLNEYPRGLKYFNTCTHGSSRQMMHRESHVEKGQQAWKEEVSRELTTGAFPLAPMTDKWTLQNPPPLEERHHRNVTSSPSHTLMLCKRERCSKQGTQLLAGLSPLQPIQKEVNLQRSDMSKQ